MKNSFGRLVCRLLIVSIAGLGFPGLSQARMIPTQVETTANHARVAAALDRQDVRAKLEAHGVALAEVKARIAALTDEEAAQLADRMDSLPAGGEGVLGILLIVFLVLLLTDILGYTKIFPFTRSIK
jgi:hypothetical protein